MLQLRTLRQQCSVVLHRFFEYEIKNGTDLVSFSFGRNSETPAGVRGAVQGSIVMRFKYAQQRVRQLKGNLQPTQSSVVIDWPTAEQKDRADEALPLSKIADLKRVQPVGN